MQNRKLCTYHWLGQIKHSEQSLIKKSERYQKPLKITRKRTSWKPMQTFQRGQPKPCVNDTYIKNKQRPNLHVKGEISFPFTFCWKKNWFKLMLHGLKKTANTSQGLNATFCLHHLLSQWAHNNSPQQGLKLSPGADPGRLELKHHESLQSLYLSLCNQFLINGLKGVSHFLSSHQIPIIEIAPN